MDSILDNPAALVALQNLSNIEQNLTITDNQVSSGLAVASASDNPGYWAIATQLDADSGLVGATNTALAQGQATLDTASTAINSIISTIDSIQTQLTDAENPNAALSTINTTLAALGRQLTDAVAGASFDGDNILNGSTIGSTANQITFVSGFNASTNKVTTISMTTQSVYNASAGTGLLVQTGTAGPDATYDLTQIGSSSGVTITATNAADALSAASAALTAITSYSTSIGAAQDRMTSASDLNSAVTTNYADAVDDLIDADMNTASARLQALQTQEELAIQALSIANQNPQLILKLFGA